MRTTGAINPNENAAGEHKHEDDVREDDKLHPTANATVEHKHEGKGEEREDDEGHLTANATGEHEHEDGERHQATAG